MWNLALSLKDNIAQGFSCAILYILPGVSRQHCTKFFVCIAVWGSSQTKLQKTTNFHKENNQCNLVSIMLGKYCLGILCSQFCVNTTKTLQCWHAVMFFQEDDLYSVILICLDWHCTDKLLKQCLPLSTNNFAPQNNLQFSGWSIWVNIAQGNVGPWLTNNFYCENNTYNSTILCWPCWDNFA